jgi:CheY-like chemotaxis protein
MGNMIRRMLHPDGHTVVTTTAGEEALELLAAEPFDVVISDVGLGLRMNGWTLAAEVRQRKPGLPFVLATGWGATIDPADARAKGIHAVLAKPYQPADLHNILAQLPLPDAHLPLGRSEGGGAGDLLVLRDVTDQNQAEAALLADHCRHRGRARAGQP